MPERPRASLAARIAAEALLWALVAGTFLAVYVGWARAPASSILLHLVAVAALGLACVRLLLAASPLPRGAARFASSALLFGAIGLLLLCYAGALVGLRSWGRVATWELVVSYVPQGGMLLDVLGFPPVAAAGHWRAPACRAARRRLDPRARAGSGRAAAERLPRRWIAFGPPALLAAIGIDLHEVYVLPPTLAQAADQPRFVPAESGMLRMQNHGVDYGVAARRDAAEDAERAAYRSAAPSARRNLITSSSPTRCGPTTCPFTAIRARPPQPLAARRLGPRKGGADGARRVRRIGVRAAEPRGRSATCTSSPAACSCSRKSWHATATARR